MSYPHVVSPSDVDSELSRSYQPGEPAAFTLARAVVAHLLPTVWEPAVGLETNGRTATVRITIAAVGVRVGIGLSWRPHDSRSPSTAAAIPAPFPASHPRRAPRHPDH